MKIREGENHHFVIILDPGMKKKIYVDGLRVDGWRSWPGIYQIRRAWHRRHADIEVGPFEVFEDEFWSESEAYQQDTQNGWVASWPLEEEDE